jgi:photosystem II stability/assembly factor-like uncharacterized protein
MKCIATKYSQFLYVFTIFLFLTFSSNSQTLDTNYFRNYKPRSIGPAGMSGRVTAIDVDLSNKSRMFVGTASGGVWYSESGGVDWEPIFDKEITQSIGAVKIQQSNPDVIWVGTGEGNPRNSQNFGKGIFKSIDGGKTWQNMGLPATKAIHRIIIHRDNPDVVFLGVMGVAYGENEERGVYKTTDGGKTWKKILYLSPKTGCADLVVDPNNPNKMFAAMYEYKREPWFFTSGGKTSGLYVTYDGGDTWTNLTDKSRTEGKSKNGLPTGEIGRIGIAIAKNNTKVVYATIESKNNALYRSKDGGNNWSMVNDKEVGDRPFYYSEIYVDPTNENRIYDINSIVKKSEDGGKSFSTLIPYSGIHPDHHAWWIDPQNPSFMIDGNDGGMAISYDMGKNWRFVENLPVGQFYHINYDMETPYNVYGGLQDNGSWRGPSDVWARGGIQNHYWKEVMFGDGFNVVPDKSDSRFGYAMWQGGNLARYDILTGASYNIKPAHPEGKPLRFHWNAAIAHDEFDNKTLYYGSQYLHKSTDRGENWTIISPDLTTNDSTKQKYGESGGLTADVTDAENHTTILAISPSKLNKNIIWVGTDDGNVQVTKDGGKTWTNTSLNMKNVPSGSWVCRVSASSYNENEAFAVINNYRRNDFKPYIMQTKDGGKTWTNIVEKSNIPTYSLSFVQDTEVPELMFVGCDEGLYVSLDAGQNWSKWTNGYPSCPTIDLKLHPRENDLIIGTFGRAIWIMDDISFFRNYIKNHKSKNTNRISLAKINDAIYHNYASMPGTHFPGDGAYRGQGSGFGAMITALVNKNLDAKKDSTIIKNAGKSLDSIYVYIKNDKNETIRFLRFKADSGYNRVYWDLAEKGIRYPGSKKSKNIDSDNGGMTVLPGVYNVVVEYMDSKDSQNVNVEYDKRIPTKIEEFKEQIKFTKELEKRFELVTEVSDRFNETDETLEFIEKQIKFLDDSTQKKFNEKLKTVKDSLKTIKDLVFFTTEKQGIIRRPDIISDNLWGVSSYINEAMSYPNTTHKYALNKVDKQIDVLIEKANNFYEKDWANFRDEVSKITINPFKEIKKFEKK